MALASVPGYYVPGGFNAAQIAGYNALTKKKVPTSPAAPTSPDLSGVTTVSKGPDDSMLARLTALFGQTPSTGYEAELLGDPSYQGVMNAYNKALAAGRTSLVGNLNSAVTQAGFDPRAGFTGDLAPYASDITDATIQSALTNPLSARAQLNAQTDVARKVLGRQLLARGVERSGELATGNTALNKQYEQQSTQQLNDLLTAVRGGVGDYQSQIASLEANKNNAIENITNRLAAANTNNPTLDDIIKALYGDGGTTDPTAGQTAPPPAAPPPAPDVIDRTLTSGQNVFTPSTPKAPTVTVDGKVFSSRSDLTRYLNSRNRNAAVWAQNNPNLWLRLGA